MFLGINANLAIAFCFSIIGFLLISLKFFGKKSFLLAGTFFYICFSALRVFQSPISPFEGASNEWVIVLDYAAAASLLTVITVILTASSLSTKVWIKIFRAVGIINALILCGSHLLGETYGILLNPSMSGCLSAVLLPLYWENGSYPILTAILLPLSILMAGQSQPIAILFILLGVFLIKNRKYNWLIFSFLISICVGRLVTGNQLLNPSGRETVWRLAFQYFQEHCNYFFGSGLGTFSTIGPYLTQREFTWLHSDWLQILWETGYIGLFLVLCLYLFSLVRSRKNSPIFYSLIAYGAFGIANMPLRYPIASLLGALLIRISFE